MTAMDMYLTVHPRQLWTHIKQYINGSCGHVHTDSTFPTGMNRTQTVYSRVRTGLSTFMAGKDMSQTMCLWYIGTDVSQTMCLWYIGTDTSQTMCLWYIGTDMSQTMCLWYIQVASDNTLMAGMDMPHTAPWQVQVCLRQDIKILTGKNMPLYIHNRYGHTR